MKVNFLKRFGAYIIDTIIIALALSIISYVIPESKNLETINSELNTLGNDIMNNSITNEVFINRYADIVHSLDKISVINNILSALLIIIYFIILPFYNKGQTLGKKLFKIRIVTDNDEEVGINELIIRNIIINGLGYTLIVMCLVFILPSLPYVITVSILGFIQILLVIISSFMISYRKDRKGIQDLLTKTKVIYEEVK